MDITADVNAMPVADRLKLMESLWDSLCSSRTDDAVSPAWHKDVLVERMARIDSGNESTSPWSEAKERIRNQAYLK